MIGVVRLFDARFQKDNENEYSEYDMIFWSRMREFIKEGMNKKDRIQRLCSINVELMNFDMYDVIGPHSFLQTVDCLNMDKQFEQYLMKNEETLFQNINEYSDLRENTSSDSISHHPIFQIFFPFLNELWSWTKQKYAQLFEGGNYSN